MVETFDASGPVTCVAVDTQLYVYDTDQTTQLAYDDDDGVGQCSFVALTGLAGGTYFWRVIEYGQNATGDYTVVATVTLGP